MSMKKNFGDYFDPKEAQKDLDPMNKQAEEIAQEIEDAYLKMTVDDDIMHLFDFDINLAEND